MLKSFWAVNKTGLNSYSVSNIMMIDFKLNRQFWKELFLNATKQKSVEIEMLQHLGIQVLSAIIIHFVIVWPISTAFLWFSCDRLDGTRWSGKLQPFVYIRFEVFVNLFAFNHCQRRIQLQCKFFMIYFMKILPTMHPSSFDCCLFSLQCRARWFWIEVQPLHLLLTTRMHISSLFALI